MYVELEEVELDKKASYDALSYAWGQDQMSSVPDRPMRMKRRTSGITQIVVVTRSVESAVQRLRSDGYDRAIWIDQISINQEDWEEKSRQMQIMGKIYEASSVVMVWLGLKSNGSSDCSDSDEAMRFLQQLVRGLNDGEEPEKYTNQGNQMRAARELLTRMWFDRAWTLEEAANAKECKVYCGNEVIDYNVLHQLYRGCQESQSRKWRNAILGITTAGNPTRNDQRVILAHILTIGKLREIQEQHRPEGRHITSTGSALMHFNRLRSCQTKDARDKVYSLYYHLAEDIKNELGKPDYHSPVEDLYRRLAVSQICTMGNLEFLAAAGMYRRNLSLPSWAPDYTYPETHYSLAVLDEDCFNRTGSHLFAAAPQVEAPAHVLKEGRMLKVRGRVLGCVKDIARPFSFSSFGDYEPRERLNMRLGEMKQQYQECIEMVKHGQVRQEEINPLTLLRLNLTCGMEVQNGGPSFGGVFVQASTEDIDQRFQALETYINAAKRLTGELYVDSKKLEDRALGGGRMQEGGLQIMVYNCSAAAAVNNVLDIHASQEPAEAVLNSFVGACQGRALFITDEGVIGLGPNMTRPEDKVCVIHGSRVPFIIRRIEEQKVWIAKGKEIIQKKYVLVGECFIHELMNGEAVRDGEVEAEDVFLI